MVKADKSMGKQYKKKMILKLYIQLLLIELWTTAICYYVLLRKKEKMANKNYHKTY